MSTENIERIRKQSERLDLSEINHAIVELSSIIAESRGRGSPCFVGNGIDQIGNMGRRKTKRYSCQKKPRLNRQREWRIHIRPESSDETCR